MIKILKGDTSADISFALAEGFDYSGATVHVEYQGAVKTFTGCAAGDVLALRFSADETAVMSLGSYPVVVRITNPSGMVKTIQNANTKICVTDDPAEVSGGAIALDVRGMLYGIEDLPERWTEADIVAKLREIMRRGGAVLCALLTFSAFGASVQTARKDAIHNDEQIVTNVTFDGLLTEHQDISGKADKSDTYTKSETDARIAELSPRTSLAPATNYTDQAIAAIPRMTTNDVCAIVTNEVGGFTDWVLSPQSVFDSPLGVVWVESIDGNGWGVTWQGKVMSRLLTFDIDGVTKDSVYLEWPQDSWFGGDAGIGGLTATRSQDGPLRNALGLATLKDLEGLSVEESDPIWSEEKSSYATTVALGSVSSIVNAWEGYWDGTNVIFEVTNYYGNTSGEIPRLRIKELRDGAWHTVWDEATKFKACESNLLHAVSESNRVMKAGLKNDFAPLAWGTVTDKGTPNVVSNSVWMTSPETYFAGGTEYQRVAVGSGTICVLVDNGAGTYTAGEAGTFRFQDEGGTNYFGFAKSDSYTIGCKTDAIAVDGTLVTLRYDIIMGGNDVPIVYYRQTLSGGEWTQLNNADGTATAGAPYTVTWYTDNGSYYAAINCGDNASGFFKAETSVAGDVVFETNMKARLDGGIECPNTATGTMGVIRPTYNGSAVSWTWSAK